MKSLKKALAMLLVVCMLASLLSTAVFADTDEIDEDVVIIDELVPDEIVDEDETAASGIEAVEQILTEEAESDTGTNDEATGIIEEATAETLNSDGTISSFAELSAAIANGGEYALSASFSKTATLTVETGISVTIDFAGYTITESGNRQSFKNNGTLIFKDSVGGGGFVAKSTAQPGAFVRNYAGAELYLEGGTISGGTSAYSESSTVTGNGYGGAIYNSGTFVMNGGTIKSCGSTTKNGGAVYVTSTGTFTMNGGTISDCSSIGNGGAVYVYGGSYNLQGGTVSGCNATENGGAIYASGGDSGSTISVSNGSVISGCTAMQGGAIYVTGGSAVTISGGIVTGNESTDKYGVIRIYNGSLNITDGIFYGNTAPETVSGFEINVHKASNGTVAVSGGWFDASVSENVTANGYYPSDAIDTAPNSSAQYTVGHYVAKIGDSNYYKTLSSAISASSDGDTIVLIDNAEVSSRIQTGKKITVTDDGNNRTIYIAITGETGTNARGIQTSTGAELTIQGTALGKLKIVGTTVNGTPGNGAALCAYNGKMALSNVMIENCTSTADGAAIYVRSEASMTNCSITGCGNKAVYLTSGTLTISNSSITNNGTESGNRAIIFIEKDGYLVLDGVTMSGNKSGPNADSGLVNGTDVNNLGNISLNDVTAEFICLSQAAQISGKIDVAKFFLYDITKNENTTVATLNAASALTEGSSFGIEVVAGQPKDSTTNYQNMYVSGTKVIDGNGLASAVAAASMLNQGTLEIGDDGILYQPAAAHTHCVCGTANCTESSHGTAIAYTALDAAKLSELNNTLTTGNYYLEESITTENKILISGTVNLCLNGHDIIANGIFDTLSIGNGNTLTLCDCQTEAGKITHAEGKTGSGIILIAGGAVNMYGGVISGNSAGSGSGIYAKGIVNLYGGTICGNTAELCGGGVYLDEGTMNMYGGVISGNEAYYGGGVYNDGGVFTMSSGEISDNDAYFGGGVFADTECTFTMSGGEISGNRANLLEDAEPDDDNGDGAGVYIDKSTFTMNGGEIKGNIARNCGGGVCSIGSAFTLTSGVISGNECTLAGGGVYSSGSTTYLNGGSISENTAGFGAGGILCQLGNEYINGTEICGNQAGEFGGGIAVFHNTTAIGSGSVFFGSGINIHDNTAVCGNALAIVTDYLQVMENEADSFHLENCDGIIITSDFSVAETCKAIDVTPATAMNGLGNISGSVLEAKYVFTSGWSDSYGTYSDIFTSGLADYYVAKEGTELALVPVPHIHTCDLECEAAASADTTHLNFTRLTQNNLAGFIVNGNLSAGSYYLAEDITISSPLNIEATVNLCLNGHKLINASTEHSWAIFISTDGKLSICDCSANHTGTICAAEGVTESYGIDFAGSGPQSTRAYLYMYGGTVSGFTIGINPEEGSAVELHGVTVKNNAYGLINDHANKIYIGDGSKFTGNEIAMVIMQSEDVTFDGVEIKNNVSTGNGENGEGNGAVQLSLGAVVTMKDVEISGNSGSLVGGLGIMYATVMIEGKVVIKDNTGTMANNVGFVLVDDSKPAFIVSENGITNSEIGITIATVPATAVDEDDGVDLSQLVYPSEGVFAKPATGYEITAADKACFFSESDTLFVELKNDGKLYLSEKLDYTIHFVKADSTGTYALETTSVTGKFAPGDTIDLTTLTAEKYTGGSYMYGGYFSGWTAAGDFTGAQTAAGTAATLTENIYVRLITASDYFKPRTLVTSLADEHRMFMLAIVDGIEYSELGFIVSVDGSDESDIKLAEVSGDKVYDSLGFTLTTGGSKSYDLSVIKPAASSITKGKILSVEFEIGGHNYDYYEPKNNEDAAATIMVTPYYVTLDGVKVTCPTARKIITNDTVYPEVWDTVGDVTTEMTVKTTATTDSPIMAYESYTPYAAEKAETLVPGEIPVIPQAAEEEPEPVAGPAEEESGTGGWANFFNNLGNALKGIFG